PEPTTVASRNAVPSASAARRRVSDSSVIDRTSGGRGRIGIARPPPDGVETLLQGEVVERGQWQADEYRDAVAEHPECFGESEPDFGFGAGRGRRIGNAPMRRHRLARPDRAAFRR